MHTLWYIFKGGKWQYKHIHTVWRGVLWSETREDSESDEQNADKTEEYSIMPPVFSLEETDALDSENESYYEPMSTEMLEDIHDRS